MTSPSQQPTRNRTLSTQQAAKQQKQKQRVRTMTDARDYPPGYRTIVVAIISDYYIILRVYRKTDINFYYTFPTRHSYSTMSSDVLDPSKQMLTYIRTETGTVRCSSTFTIRLVVAALTFFGTIGSIFRSSLYLQSSFTTSTGTSRKVVVVTPDFSVVQNSSTKIERTDANEMSGYHFLDVNSANSTETATAAFDCTQVCRTNGEERWAADKDFHQFFQPDDDVYSLTSILSKHAYMSMADLASDFERRAPIHDTLLKEHQDAAQCLLSSTPSGILIIYISTGFPRAYSIRRDLSFLMDKEQASYLPIPHVVLTSGPGNVWKTNTERLAKHNPYLIRWYGSSQVHKSTHNNGDSKYAPNAYPLPLGLTTKYETFEQLKYAAQVLKESTKKRGWIKKKKDVLINFGPTGSAKTIYRSPPYNRFCNVTHPTYYAFSGGGGTTTNSTSPPSSFRVTCTPHGGMFGSRNKLIDWAKNAVHVYRDWALHRYTVNPRGQSPDCHRFWESLYLQSVPIVLSSDPYYQNLVTEYFPNTTNDLPILFVDSWDNVTEELLAREWRTRFQPIFQGASSWPPMYLTTKYVRELVERGVRKEVSDRASKEGSHKNKNAGSTIWRNLHANLQARGSIWANRTRCYTQSWR